MGWFDNLKTKFNNRDTELRQARMLSGQTPVFSQFGSDVYVSDVMQQCMACITDEMRKVRLQHIVKKDGKEFIKDSKLNRLFEYGVNDLMTTSDFMEKATYNLLKNMNSFIYPVFSYTHKPDGTVKSREVEALYPLNPKKVTFLIDAANRIYLKMEFNSGDDFTLPYENVVHWRMRYSENEYLGGNMYGEAEVEDLLKTVQLNDRLLQGVDKAVEVSLNTVGMMKYPQYVDREKVDADVAKFEKALRNKESAIIGLDAKAEYVPMNVDPKLIDKDTLEFVDNKILRHWGCSLPMLNGTATPAEHQAFYQKAIEPKLISFQQSLTKVIFTPLEFSNGNRVTAYPEELVFLNTEQKLSFATLMADRGALTNNQLLGIFGIPPYEGGDVRYMSLNYCDVNIANQYQLNKAGAEKGGAKVEK